MTDEEYKEAQNPKVRTTIFLEENLIRAFKKEATKRGMKYQQLMREKLKEAISEIDQGLEDRLVRLEAAVFKKVSDGSRSKT